MCVLVALRLPRKGGRKSNRSLAPVIERRASSELQCRPRRYIENEGKAVKKRMAILDDYQNVVRDYADWSAIEDRVDITVFHDTLGMCRGAR